MADYEIPKLVDRRLRYFHQQFLQEQDFVDEQIYHVSRQRLHNRALHTEGIVEGLTTTSDVGATQVRVAPGAALDNEGRMIILVDETDITLTDAEKSKIVFLVISYPDEEVPDRLAAIGHTRWYEKPSIQFVPEAGAPPASTHIRLKKLTIDDQGRIKTIHADDGVVQRAGVSLGSEVVLAKLRLQKTGVAPEQWPVVYSGDPGRVDVEGALRVTPSPGQPAGAGPQLHVRDRRDRGAATTPLTLKDHVAVIENTSPNPAGVLALQVQNQDWKDKKTPFVTFYSGDKVVGRIASDTGPTLLSGGSDFAEWLPKLHADEAIEEGDIVGVFAGQVTKTCTGAHHVMAVSSEPVVAGNMPGADEAARYVQVAFLGQVPVKVRGVVQAGDLLFHRDKTMAPGWPYQRRRFHCASGPDRRQSVGVIAGARGQADQHRCGPGSRP